MSVKLVYFAWVRERIGFADETVTLPEDVKTVADVLNWLVSRGDNYAYAFEKAPFIRAAIDRKHAPHATSVSSVREIAFFPPMTGG